PYGAPRIGGGPVSHEAVMAARQAYPKDTCHQLAERLNCSTSTIKRHLRRAREEKVAPQASVTSTVRTQPTIEAVLDCFDELESSRVA
ncbi:MAG: HTH domain-containing protein, partial [Aeromicrobium sp.]